MRSKFGRTIILTVAALAWAIAGPSAQTTTFQAVSPFDVIGFIDAATLDVAPANADTDPTDLFARGGTITVNGIVITVPKNTLLQMPAFALTWQEVFTMAPAPWERAASPGWRARIPTRRALAHRRRPMKCTFRAIARSATSTSPA